MDFGVAETPRPVGKAPAIVPPSTGQAQTPSDDLETLLARVEGIIQGLDGGAKTAAQQRLLAMVATTRDPSPPLSASSELQPSTRELVSVDNWYQLGNSSPTTTEVLVYTLLVELVVGPDREAFMGAVEAEMTPNTVPQDGEGEGVWRAPSTLTHYKGVVGGCIKKALSNYSKDAVQGVAQVLANFPGAGRLDGVLPSANLKKYLSYHGEGKLLGPAPVGTKSKGQKRAVAALPQITMMMRAEGPALNRMLLNIGDPDQPKSATKAGLKQKLAEHGRALDLSEEIHSKVERQLQQTHSKLKLARAKQTSVVKDRVGVKMAKIKERAVMEIESVKANAYDEAEALVGKEWGKDIELIKRLQDNLAALQKHDKSLAWYKERYHSAEFKYQKLAEQKHTEAELREQLKKSHEIINSERDRAVAAEQTLSRQPSIFPSLNRGSGRGAGTGRPWTPEFEDMAIMLLATGSSVPHIRSNMAILLSFLGAEFSIPEDDWFKKRRDTTGFRSEIYAFMDVARAKDIHEMGFDESQVDGISTCNLWVRVTNTLDQIETKQLGCAKALIGGTAEEIANHVDTQFSRGREIVGKIRQYLQDQGHDPDLYCPELDGGVQLHKLRALMHDTCNAANAAAREIARRKTISGQDYFTPDVWNSMGPDIQTTLDFLCGNHTRQLPVAAYIRLVDKWLGEVLGEKMSLIKQQVNPRLRLETKSSTLRHSIQKQTHCGWGTYAKGDGERFKHNASEVASPEDPDYEEKTSGILVGVGRAGVGERQEGQASVAYNLYPQIPVILLYNHGTLGLEPNLLRDSVYIRLRELPFVADIHVLAITYHTIYDELRAMTNSNDMSLDPFELAVYYEHLWQVGVMLKDHDTQMEIFDVDYRPWPIHEKMQTWLNKRDAVQVVKSGTNKQKVFKREFIGNLLRMNASAQNEDWPAYESYLRSCLTFMGEGIHESLQRTCKDFLGVTNGKFSPDKVETWMRAMAVHCLAHNNKAEGPFALVKMLNKQFPIMRLETQASLTTCRMNGTYRPAEAKAKTRKTQVRQAAAGGAKSAGQGLTAPKPVQEAVRALTKLKGAGAKRRRTDEEQDRSKQAASEKIKEDHKLSENKRLTQQRLDNSNVHKEQELFETEAALKLALEATGSSTEAVQCLKAQMNARVTGHGWAYPSLPASWLHQGKPRLADQSNSGVDAQRTYLTKLVEEAIKIDLQEGRYLALASSAELPAENDRKYLKRQLGYEVGDLRSISQQAKRYRVRDEAEADALQPEDDPTLVQYEAQFLPDGAGEIFVDVLTAMRGRGKKRKEVTVEERFYRVVAVSYSDQNEELGGVWGVDAVPVDRFGAVPDAHRTCSVAQCGPCCTQHVKSRSLVFYGLQSETEVDESVAKMVADYKGRFGEPVAADPQAGV